jgi:hypothetical protein
MPPNSSGNRAERECMCHVDLENLTASFGLVRREFRDVHAIASRLDTQLRRLIEPRALPRPGGLVARFAAVECWRAARNVRARR